MAEDTDLETTRGRLSGREKPKTSVHGSPRFAHEWEKPAPFDVRVIALLLAAKAELDQVERELKRNRHWRHATRVGSVRTLLDRAIATEEDKLSRTVAAFAIKE